MVNRNTTYESLEAIVYLIFAKDEETYCKYYKLATHEDAGKSSWFYIEKRYVKKEKTAAEKEYHRNYYREYMRRRKRKYE